MADPDELPHHDEAASQGWPLMMACEASAKPDDFAPAARDFNPDLHSSIRIAAITRDEDVSPN